nr:MAG TPA: hypothetical protein [Caudoviricetes sp.]
MFLTFLFLDIMMVVRKYLTTICLMCIDYYYFLLFYYMYQ